MPRADVRGVSIHYEIVGGKGPWVALSPGGRRPLEGVKPPAQRVAGAGYRVLIPGADGDACFSRKSVSRDSWVVIRRLIIL
jgi:hypothetical protein